VEKQDNPLNYIGIVINSCIGKLFTKILNSRLNEYLAKRNVIPIEQIGFTKKKRTVYHMFILRSLVEQHTKRGSKPLYTCFIDFRKAFNSVWLQGLFYKMRQIVKEIYSKTKLCVKSANSLTEFFQSNVGEWQGDNLSPNLFKICIHDVQKELDSSYYPVMLNKTLLSCLLYADDMI
jgi:hypothetical protein